jgi:tetratricopeptide (TPR) repeat protein
MMRKTTLLPTCLALVAIAAPVAADEKQDCAGANTDRKIQACTMLIESKLETGTNLATAYRNRAVGHSNKKEYDQAITDLNKAIELNPKYAAAYNDRALAYTNKGDFQRAVADVNKAVELDQASTPKQASTSKQAPAPKTAVAAPASVAAKPSINKKPAPVANQTSAKPVVIPKQPADTAPAPQPASEFNYPAPKWAKEVMTPVPDGK